MTVIVLINHFNLTYLISKVFVVFCFKNEMHFGEIVEPSTRALLDDEFVEYPEYSEPFIQWTGQCDVPEEIHTLVFIESKKIVNLFKNFVLCCDTVLLGSLDKSGISIFKKGNKYIVIFEGQQELTTGQIIEILSLWLRRAEHIYTITSSSLASYQNKTEENTECVVRVLNTQKSSSFKYAKLEAPNLITGLGANVLHYCVHLGLQCSTFILYLNAAPLDSINSKPLLELAEKLLLSPKYNTIVTLPSNNLYM